MPDELPDPVFDALLKATKRRALATGLDTAGLRKIAAQLKLNSVFTARGTSKIFASKIKEVVDLITADTMGEADGVLALFETIKALGYTPEGGFPDAPPGVVPPAVEGTLQDLSSVRRLEFIVRTQVEITTGAGQKMRGEEPDQLEAFPAYELVRVMERDQKRDWLSRWKISGGVVYPHEGNFGELYSSTGCIALKGDPVFGELGSSGNFEDALDVDFSPFAFGSGIGLREVSRARCIALGVRGPSGETMEEWFTSRPATLSGNQPLPAPSLSMKDVDPQLVQDLKDETGAVDVPRKPDLVRLPPSESPELDFSDLLKKAKARRDAARGKGGA